MSGGAPAAPVEEGDPALDPRAFRRALGQFATGVTVVTAAAGERLVGVTANSFASVSLDPPLVLWSNAKTALSRAVFAEASHFAVNVLAADQMALAGRFARSGRDKFADVAWRPGAGGAPLLQGVVASLECRREAEHEGGDHLIMVGRVERYARHDRGVLLFSQGRYGLALDHPELAEEAGSGPDPGEAHPLDDFMIPLLLRAYERLSERFERHRREEGLTLEQSRVLAFLAAHPHPALATIARATFLGLATAEDAIADLVGQGLAARSGSGQVGITGAGRAKLQAVLARTPAFEKEALAGLDPRDVAATRRTLRQLAGAAPGSGRKL